MIYFKGTRQNNQVIFIAVDASQEVKCSNGFIRAKDEKKWEKANANTPEYIRILLALQGVPLLSKRSDYLADVKIHDTEQRKVHFEKNEEKQELIKKQEVLLKNQDNLIEEQKELISNQSDIIISLMKILNDKDELIKKIKISQTDLISVKKNSAEVETEMLVNELKDTLKILTVKYNLADSEIRKYVKDSKFIQTERDSYREKLENLQRVLKISRTIEVDNDKENSSMGDKSNSDVSLGRELDGSRGFHDRRENGRYGSLSSFDNYGDEYNEKNDPQEEQY